VLSVALISDESKPAAHRGRKPKQLQKSDTIQATELAK